MRPPTATESLTPKASIACLGRPQFAKCAWEEFQRGKVHYNLRIGARSSQLVEHPLSVRKAGGSIPSVSTSLFAPSGGSIPTVSTLFTFLWRYVRFDRPRLGPVGRPFPFCATPRLVGPSIDPFSLVPACVCRYLARAGGGVAGGGRVRWPVMGRVRVLAI